MPKGRSKKFIDKNNSVTFHLVHRSQQDPLAADETAPQRVLVPVGSVQSSKSETKTIDKKKRKEEQQKYGIFFDDEYDYLQHLKDVNTLPVEWERVEQPNKTKDDKKDAPKINLPSSVFASTVEEEVGLLNKAAPVSGLRLDLDPDVVAAMDDDFAYDDPDNILEDDFIALANAGESDEEFNEEDEDNYEDESDVSSGNMALSDEERDEVCSLNGPQYTFNDEETKSRFTQYSMSSSVIRRNEQLTLLDNKFEKMYASYDDIEIGPLECDEIEGHVAPNSDIMLQYALEFEKEQKEATENISKLMENRLKIMEENDAESEEELEKIVTNPNENDQWDCQSILSTYSNIYNHPKLISAPPKLGKIEINKRTGIPKNVLNGKPGKLTSKFLEELDMQYQMEKNQFNREGSVAGTMKSVLSVLSVRPKNETPEERKDRKAALKDYRKARRAERKSNKEAFKEEKKHQEKLLMNNKYSKSNRVL
ncbi:hypothetical protein PV328_009026 [Microctonus aethiopoides]|uniref:Protein LTV1 homolog n=1 Tax=Microctonus aethiopoides TaxID=144406 RepID=A0AA39KRJ9_9HYME|nr:hypothetical protein PV328_009026 [Microctonus aethiopoides]